MCSIHFSEYVEFNILDMGALHEQLKESGPYDCEARIFFSIAVSPALSHH